MNIREILYWHEPDRRGGHRPVAKIILSDGKHEIIRGSTCPNRRSAARRARVKAEYLARHTSATYRRAHPHEIHTPRRRNLWNRLTSLLTR